MRPATAVLDMDLSLFQDYDERRRAQNREAQRKYRQRLKRNSVSADKRKDEVISNVKDRDMPATLDTNQKKPPETSVASPSSITSQDWAQEYVFWGPAFSPNEITLQSGIDNPHPASRDNAPVSRTPASELQITSLVQQEEQSSWLLADEGFSQDGASSSGGFSSTEHQTFNNMAYVGHPSSQNMNWASDRAPFERNHSAVTLPISSETGKHPTSQTRMTSCELSKYDSHVYCTPRSEGEFTSTDEMRRSSISHAIQHPDLSEIINDTNVYPNAANHAPKANIDITNTQTANRTLLQRQLGSFRTRALRTTDRLLELYDLGLCLDLYNHDESLRNLLILVHERFADLIKTDDVSNLGNFSSDGEILVNASYSSRLPKRRKFTDP
ncbi:hypothetical protein PVAG01_11368 [Phlyctema vagabunda]|uniref:BZIP domain-containing protein n=1 Tax=Phlyctema vagabunda TaxID=108571 RepID=A0ABR4P240_9HELO